MKHIADWIPSNVVAAAEKAGLGLPMWYVGRSKGPTRPRQKTLKDITVEARLQAANQRNSTISNQENTNE